MLENMLTEPESFEVTARGNKTVWENLHMLRVMRAQCLVWYLKAKNAEDVQTMFLLETEIQYLMALEAGVKWSLGLSKGRLVSPTRVAMYNQRREMDEAAVAEGI